MKTYHAPKLVDYGDIASVTAMSNDSMAQDFDYDQNGNLIGTGEGSLNRCYFKQGTRECIIND